MHERLITGDPDPKLVKTAVATALAKLSPEEKEDDEAVRAARQAAVESFPRAESTEDAFDVIDKLWAIKAEEMMSAADTNTHGVAKFRFNELASYTGELRKGFRPRLAKRA